MQHIKELLIKQINEYDKQAAKSCQNIVIARLANKDDPLEIKRMMSGIASAPRLRGEEALRHFAVLRACRRGESSGLLEKTVTITT